jgi:hypothetical protein
MNAMFATANKKSSAASEPAGARTETASKAEPDSNPTWQTLAFNALPIQRKLTISQPDDPYEREADATADRVMRMHEPSSISMPLSLSPLTSPGPQRKCASCHENKCASCQDEERKLQRKANGQNANTADSAPQLVTSTLNSPGQPLDQSTRSFMEERFGHDFGNVRAHINTTAADSAASIHARAYTVGQNIVFGRAAYAPATTEGRHLIAHELAHVVQQAGSGGANSPEALPLAQRTPDLHVQRVVDPEYVVDEPGVASPRAGVPLRIFFARNSAVIPASETAKIDSFKSGANQSVNLTLFGLATEDELATLPTLPTDRATAVETALGTALANPPHTAHTGTRTVTVGTIANTRERANIRNNRAVEVLRPGESTLSPAGGINPATACNATIEAALQSAKTMAFNWVRDTRRELRVRPIAGSIAADLDRFFGNHRPETARRVHHNLEEIRDELRRIARPANHVCADPNLPTCVSALASNSGGRMTICPSVVSRSTEELASVIFHEAAHSTPSLRIRGLSNVSGTTDFAYRQERLVHLLGVVDPDQALSNSDSYAMLLMSRRAPGAIPPEMLPTTDPAPTGFANAAQELDAQRAVALAQVWIRLARQALTDLHGRLRRVGTGNPVPASLPNARLNSILTEVPVRFPPILAGPNFDGDDLLMIGGVIDSYTELSRLMRDPIALSPGATTAFTVVPAVGGGSSSLTLTVDAAFLGATEQVRTRTIVDSLIRILSTARISVAMRPNYGDFAEFCRNLHQ